MIESLNQTAAANQSQCDELAAAVLAYCETNRFKIAAAESLTGGLLADAFVRVPGASKVFLGSAVTYDIRAKASILGVDAELLRREGGCSSRSGAPDGFRNGEAVPAAGGRRSCRRIVDHRCGRSWT